jgi:hypothetical protein
MTSERTWLLLLLAPVFWLFTLHFRRSLQRYAGRDGGRPQPARRSIALLLTVMLLMAILVLWLQR